MLTGAITEADAKFSETWENVSPMHNWIIRLGPRGEERPEPVAGPRSFLITTEERLLTQDKIADSRHDPFTNGCFRPVIVPSNINIETNPNALSDDDIRRLFGASDRAWDEYMKVIDSPATVQRMIDLAGDADGLLHERFVQLQERAKQLSPRKRLVSKDQELLENIETEPRPRGKRVRMQS